MRSTRKIADVATDPAPVGVRLTAPDRGRSLLLTLVAPGLVAAVAVGLLVATRSGSTASTPRQAAVAGSAPATAPRAVPPIYAAVYDSTGVNDVILSAQERLISGCMSGRGFTYNPGAPEPAGTAPRPNPFGVEDIAAAAPIPADTRTETRVPDAERYGRALYGSTADRVTAKGDTMSISRPGSGCLAKAQSRLLGGEQQRWSQVRIRLYEVEMESRQALEGDAQFRAVAAQWRGCIKQAGFSAGDPVDLLMHLPPRTDLALDPSVRADLACKHSTGYLTVGYARLAVVQTRLLARDPSLLADWTRLLTRQRRVAREVLSGDRPAVGRPAGNDRPGAR